MVELDRSANSDLLGTITFPALQFRKVTVATVHCKDEITRMSKVGIRKRLLEGTKIVDSAGNLFTVKRAIPGHIVLPRFAMVEFIGYLTGNPRYRMSLEFSPVQRASVPDVMTWIDMSFTLDHWWTGLLDFEEFQEAVRNAKTVPEIIAVFQKFKQ